MLPPAPNVTAPSPEALGRRAFFWGCAGILLVAVVVRWLGIDRSLWIDEAGSLDQAQAANFWLQARNDVHPPLYFFLLRGLLHLTHSFAGLRLFSLVCGVALVGLVLYAWRQHRFAALVAGWLFATWPGFVEHGKELRPYSFWYVLLGASLLLAGRQWRKGPELRASCLLAGALMLAACTHLLTFPFIVALFPVLFWPARRGGPRAWLRATWPALPAVALLLVWRYAFVAPPDKMQEGWWMPPATVHQVLWSLNQVGGWSDIGWLYNWGQRTLPGLGSLLATLSSVAIATGAGAAWLNRRAGGLAWALLACAIAYLAAVWTYSLLFEPIVWPRTLLPLILPFGLSLGWALAKRTDRRLARLGAAGLLVYSLCALVHPVRTAHVPFENLQGLAKETQRNLRPSDCLVLMRSMDFALRPYWPDLDSRKPVRLNLAHADPGPFALFRERLHDLGPDARVVFVVRQDQYYIAHPERFESVLSEVRATSRAPHEVWRDGLYHLLVAEPAPPAP